MQKISFPIEVFILPILVIVSIIFGLFHVQYAYLIGVVLGLGLIVFDSYHEIRAGRYSLDYVAFVAMVTSIVSGQYLAGAVVALMFTGGKALDIFASSKAEMALRSLSDTIPKECFVKNNSSDNSGDGSGYTETSIQDIKEGQVILVKRNEIVALDGVVVTKNGGLFNLSNLTGEVDLVNYESGTFVKSGAINAGDTIELSVVGDFSSSTYHKIVKLVDEARANPARIVRLSEKANLYFTLTAFVLAVLAYLFSGELARSLAVLVIATPCPLIIAAPVAFISGMSRLARMRIIVRKPAALEVLSKASKIFFDKTGTLTMGEPALSHIEILDKASALTQDIAGQTTGALQADQTSQTENSVLQIAAGIEIHSLHPLARALVHKAKELKLDFKVAEDIHENIGKGIAGLVGGMRYTIGAATHAHEGIVLALREEVSEKEIAYFYFTDTLKTGAIDLIQDLKSAHIITEVITGDKQKNAEAVFGNLDVVIHTDASPDDKYRIVDEARKNNQIVVMVGDGLNDAPALSRAHAGIVFSGTENGASIEAADIVVLDAQISKLKELFVASNWTVKIAKQSIYGGILLSIIGMIFAVFGFITPVAGALIQEAIDIIVILNALRALRGGE